MTELTVTLRDFGDSATGGKVYAVPRVDDTLLSGDSVLHHGEWPLLLNSAGALAGQGTLKFPADEFPAVMWDIRMELNSGKKIRRGPYTAEQIAGVTTLAALIDTEPLDSVPGNVGVLITVASGSVTPPEYPVGSYLGYLVTGTATIAGTPVDPGVWVFVHEPDGWVGYKAGGGVTAEPDVTAPTAGTLSSSGVTSSGFTLTVTGAADETALAPLPYRFSTDGGSTYGAWRSTPLVLTDMSPSTAYTCRHQTRDAAGNIATGSSITVTTSAPPPGWATVASEPFTYADATTLGTITTAGTTWADSSSSGSIAIVGNKAAYTVHGNVGTGALIKTTGKSMNRVSCDYYAGTSSNSGAGVLLSRNVNGVVFFDSVRAYVNGSGTLKIEAHTMTTVTVAAQPLTGTLVAEANGTALTVRINGTEVATATLPGPVDGRFAGIYLPGQSAVTPTVDNWTWETQ